MPKLERKEAEWFDAWVEADENGEAIYGSPIYRSPDETDKPTTKVKALIGYVEMDDDNSLILGTFLASPEMTDRKTKEFQVVYKGEVPEGEVP